MRLIKRVAAALAATAGVALAGSGVAAADVDPNHHHHGLIGDITILAPINVHIVDNAIAVLGVAEHEED